MPGVEPGREARQALMAGAGLTLLALVEHTFAPWRPFYLGYAALSILIPAMAMRRPSRPEPAGTPAVAPRVRRSDLLIALVLPVLLQLAAGVLFTVLQPEPSLDAALGAVFEAGARQWATTPERMRLGYLVFIVLWAGYGEELFYRGYLHARLRAWKGRLVATLLSSALFGLRHAMQLALLWPDYPWEAAFVWVLFSTIAGAAFAWLYDRSGSLLPPVVGHYILNLIPLLALLLGGGS